MSGTVILASRPTRSKVRLTVLLAVAMFINYVDRGNLSTAAPLLKTELQLTATQMGLLLSAFFWTYAPSQPGVGWLAERYGVRWLMAGGVALWGLATAATGLAAMFITLLVLRLLLGLGESVVFPCSSKVLARTAPVTERVRANAAMTVGMSLGAAFGTFVGGMLMAQVGWRIVFILFGVASLVWIGPWLMTTRRPDTIRSSPPTPPFRKILLERSAWGAALGQFCFAYGHYFVLLWLPLYLVKERGLSMMTMAHLGGVVYVLQAASAALAGSILDWRIAAGSSVNLAYKTAIGAGMLGLAGAFVACASGGPVAAIAGMLIAGSLLGVGAPVMFAIAQTLAGPTASGQWVGFQNAIANLAGILAPLITGVIVDRTGQFSGAFGVAGTVVTLGAIAWTVIIRRVEPLRWT
jgi:MFS family permease